MKENEHFDLTMWVCISKEFDVKIIVENIIVSHEKETWAQPSTRYVAKYASRENW